MSGPLSNPYMFKSAAGAAGIYPYQITNSLKLNGTSQALERSFSSTPSNADAKALSFWIKRSGTGNSAFGSTTNTKLCSSSTGSGAVADMLEINTNNPTGYSDQFHYYLASGGANYLKAKWRDPSAWIHIVWIYNSDESTTTDRIKVYINGESNTINDSNYWDNDGNNGYPSSGADTSFGLNGNEMHIGRYVYNDAGWWGGQMADFIMIDGTASISDFGETHNGVWRPKDPSGLTFGNNGFWLKFTNASNPGEDFSGNDNDFTNIGSIATHDQTSDSPTNNFCTINPVYRGEQTSDAKYGVISKGNLQHEFSGSTDGQCPCTHKTPASGKWYFEYVITGGGGSSSYSPAAGIIDPNTYTMNGGNYNDTGSIQYLNNTNTVRKSGSETGAYSGSRGSNNDVMGIAVDMDNGAFYVSKNGTFQTISGGSQGDPTSGASRTGAGATWTPASEFTSGMVPLSSPTGGSQPIIIMNFGQEGTFANIKTAGGNSDGNGHGNFFSAVPSGYLAICTANLSVVDEIDPAQTDDNYPQKLFNPLLYTGNGGTNNITGLGFQPDFTWIKIRNTPSNGPLVDSSRGTNKIIFSQITDTEVTSANLTSFDSDGFSLDGTSDYLANFNGNTNTYASWNWRANGGTTSTNTEGDTNSTVQVDPSGHFSIVLGTGDNDSWGNSQTFGHGLSAAPTCIIGKQRTDNADEWQVFFSDYGGATIGGSNAACNSLVLNSHVALYTNQSYKGWGGVMPTSTVFTLDGNNLVGNTHTFVCYCFANCEGYIKSGSYAANGNANGVFVYTGFRPAWVMIKAVDTGAEWTVYDDKRDPFNEADHVLQMDIHDAERTDLDEIDILSNGFKCLATGGRTNQSGKHYVYLAMAKNPFKYATAR